MNKVSLYRRLSQALLVAFIAFVGIRHQISGGGPEGSAPLDSYCPFGGIETLVYYMQTGQFIEKTNISNFILLLAVLILGVVAGAAFCSWLCPLGTVQEWLAKLGKKIFGRNYEVPAKAHRVLRYLRYVTLFLIVYLTVQGSRLVFEEYDPFKVLFHFNFETTTAIVIFVLTIVLSILIDRFWCKYLCPLGAVFSVLSRFNLINIRRNREQCTDCGLCTKKCFMKIDVANETKVSSADCTKCLECVNSCPKPEALMLTIGGGK